jgi:uncharacterized protein YchJ
MLVAAGVAITGSIAGCSGGSEPQTPKEVTRSYLSAYTSGEYEETLSYTAGQKAESLTEEEVVKAETREAEFEIVREEKTDDGNEALVSYVYAAETALGDASSTACALLVKEEGEWMVVTAGRDPEDVSPDQAESFT